MASFSQISKIMNYKYFFLRQRFAGLLALILLLLGRIYTLQSVAEEKIFITNFFNKK